MSDLMVQDLLKNLDSVRHLMCLAKTPVMRIAASEALNKWSGLLSAALQKEEEERLEKERKEVEEEEKREKEKKEVEEKERREKEKKEKKKDVTGVPPYGESHLTREGVNCLTCNTRKT